eukprot:1743935-Pleurochrysis_carterae.AAC.4
MKRTGSPSKLPFRPSEVLHTRSRSSRLTPLEPALKRGTEKFEDRGRQPTPRNLPCSNRLNEIRRNQHISTYGLAQSALD